MLYIRTFSCTFKTTEFLCVHVFYYTLYVILTHNNNRKPKFIYLFIFIDLP